MGHLKNREGVPEMGTKPLQALRGTFNLGLDVKPISEEERGTSRSCREKGLFSRL